MALCGGVQRLTNCTVQQNDPLYADIFPIEVHDALAQLVEQQPWNELDPENPQHDMRASLLINNLFHQLERRIILMDDYLLRVKLIDAVNYLKTRFSGHPQQLVRAIQRWLLKECRVAQQAEDLQRGVAGAAQLPQNSSQEINEALEKLKAYTHETRAMLHYMIQIQETFVFEYQESSSRQAQLQMTQNSETIATLTREKHMFDESLKNKRQELMHMRRKIIEQFHKTLSELGDMQGRALDEELNRWRRAQQLAGNGVPFENNLDQIQEWCEKLADVIWENRHHINHVKNLCSELLLNSCGRRMVERLIVLENKAINLLSDLITSSFIIEKQPPQVMKTNTRFSATVRLLVGSKMGIYMNPPTVKVNIISENQAIALSNNDSAREASGEILNNVGTMEYNPQNRQLSVSFRNMQLQKIKRPEKKGTESVMDEKFALLFQSQFEIGGGDVGFQVWSSSLPVVVIVHGNQETFAWATVTWDNAFSKPGRVPFEVPETVNWNELAEVLSTKFEAVTGRCLTEENLQFLAAKVFRNPAILRMKTEEFKRATQSSQHQDSAMMVTWSQFRKEPLPGRLFTFWEWFYATMKVTKEHLKNLWTDGRVEGFIDRNRTEELLKTKCPGTFLIRFSDSILGGVTVGWMVESVGEV